MNKEEIKEYLKRTDELELKLTGEDKDTYQWVLFGYNQCAKLLNETQKEFETLQQENQELKKQLHDASIQIQELIEQDIWCPSNCEKLEKLQQENKHLDKVNCKLRKTNEQLKDNWIKLRKWIVYNKHNENTEQHYLVVDYGMLLGKMRELQGSDNK